MSERRLVITVGTSLFSSASWRAEGRLLEFGGYKEWLSEDYLEKPGVRRTRGWKTAQHLQEMVEKLATSPKEIATRFDWNPDQPLRYPGELTTLIRLFRREGKGSETVEQFLRRGYSQIDLVCPTGGKNPSRLAAEQLQLVLKDVLKHTNCKMAEVLRSPHLTDLVEHFGRYLQSLPEAPTDILVTGGYKAFALVAGLMAAHRKPGEWRLLYLHDEQEGQLVIGELDANRRWRQSSDYGYVISELPPSPVGE